LGEREKLWLFALPGLHAGCFRDSGQGLFPGLLVALFQKVLESIELLRSGGHQLQLPHQ